MPVDHDIFKDITVELTQLQDYFQFKESLFWHVVFLYHINCGKYDNINPAASDIDL